MRARNLAVCLLVMLLQIVGLPNQPASRGYTVWIVPCGYAYYMTKTDDGLPSVQGFARTFEEVESIIRGQPKRDDDLREQLRRAKRSNP